MGPDGEVAITASVDGRRELFEPQTLGDLSHEHEAVQGTLIVGQHAVRRTRHGALFVQVVLTGAVAVDRSREIDRLLPRSIPPTLLLHIRSSEMTIRTAGPRRVWRQCQKFRARFWQFARRIQLSAHSGQIHGVAPPSVLFTLPSAARQSLVGGSTARELMAALGLVGDERKSERHSS
jgi:hypothetical protein